MPKIFDECLVQARATDLSSDHHLVQFFCSWSAQKNPFRQFVSVVFFFRKIIGVELVTLILKFNEESARAVAAKAVAWYQFPWWPVSLEDHQEQQVWHP